MSLEKNQRIYLSTVPIRVTLDPESSGKSQGMNAGTL